MKKRRIALCLLFCWSVYLFAAQSVVDQIDDVKDGLRLHFGHVYVGEDSLGAITHSGGETGLTIYSLHVTGSRAFSLVDPPQFPYFIEPGEVLELTYRFQPHLAGQLYAYAHYSTDSAASPQWDTYLGGFAWWPDMHSLPYIDNFDSLHNIDIPPGWQRLVESNGYEAGLSLWTDPQSYSNGGMQFNGGYGINLDSNLYLISPQIPAQYDLSQMQLSFNARGSGANLQMIVGTIADPTDSSTFEPRDTLALALAQDYLLDLSGYNNQHRYLVFYMHITQAHTSAILQNIVAELVPANDLRALSISGEYSCNSSGDNCHWVKVLNRGTEAQSNYRVIIEDANRNPLGVSPGLVVQPGQTVNVPVIWRPQGSGLQVVYANLENSGDQNPQNNRSGLFRINSTSNLIIEQVGSGTDYIRAPFSFYHAYSIWQCMYYPAELGKTGLISSVYFDRNTDTSIGQNRTFKVFIGETDLPDLSGGMISSGLLTEVYSQNLSYISGSRVLFSFNEPYHYQGGNLVLMIVPLGPASQTEYDYYFYGQPANSARCRLANGSSAFDHLNVSANIPLYIHYPRTGFIFEPDEGGLDLQPGNCSFPHQLCGGVQSAIYSLVNTGLSAIVINQIYLTGDAAFSLVGNHNLPLSLAPAQRINLRVDFAPDTPGDYRATLMVRDNMARALYSRAFTGRAFEDGIDSLPYRDGFDNPLGGQIPLNWYGVGNVNFSPSYAVFNSYPASISINNGDISYPQAKLSSLPISPQVAGQALQLSFAARSLLPATIEVGLGVEANDPQDFELLASFASIGYWQIFRLTIEPGVLDGKSICFRYPGGTSSNSIYLDDLVLMPLPQYDLEIGELVGNLSPRVGYDSSYRVNVVNRGTNPASGYQIQLVNILGETLASGSGTLLQPGESAQVSLVWVPQVVGEYSIRAGINWAMDAYQGNNYSPYTDLQILSHAELITVGNGVWRSAMPISYNHRSSLSQFVITQDELGGFWGYVDGIRLFYEFNHAVPSRPLKVWMGTSPESDLSEGWIPASMLSLVYDGVLEAYPAGAGYLDIGLDESFDFRNGDNLVISILRELDNIAHGVQKNFITSFHPDRICRSFNTNDSGVNPEYPQEEGISHYMPNILLMVRGGGVGSLSGTVLNRFGQPLAGVSVSIDEGIYETLTDQDGSFAWPHLIAGEHLLSCYLHGYYAHLQNVSIDEGGSLELELALDALPVISLSGRLVASDTAQGLADASIWLYGYEDYQLQTDAAGCFVLPEVWGDQDYLYRVVAQGYQTLEGTWALGFEDLELGDILINELAPAPYNLVASWLEDSMVLTWQAPGDQISSLSEGFEADAFPPTGWQHVISNTGDQLSSGLYPTWSRAASVNPGTGSVYPPQGSFQAGVNWADSPQDEWLISPAVICPPDAILRFATYLYYGSTAGDHYYLKVSVDDGYTWDILWDASALEPGWNHYQEPVVLDLASYATQCIRLAWHAQGIESNGLWYTWMIDDVYLGNALPPDKSRALEGYALYRLREGQESDMASWQDLAELPEESNQFTDEAFMYQASGTFRWAIKALYTAEVSSEPAFSNAIEHVVPDGKISGLVRSANLQPIPGAEVRMGDIHTTCNQAGAYVLTLPVGIYDITASAIGYHSKTITGVEVFEDQSTTANFVLDPGSGDDDPQVPAVTELSLVYPNPFRDALSISYSLKESLPVSLEVFNIRGQRIRSLVGQNLPAGRHEAFWDGRDSFGDPVSSGIYFLKMRTSNYSRSLKLLKLKD